MLHYPDSISYVLDCPDSISSILHCPDSISCMSSSNHPAIHLPMKYKPSAHSCQALCRLEQSRQTIDCDDLLPGIFLNISSGAFYRVKSYNTTFECTQLNLRSCTSISLLFFLRFLNLQLETDLDLVGFCS